MKFTFEGEIKITFWLRTITDTLYLFCSVSDSGIGIKEDDLSKLFKPFGMLLSSVQINKTGKIIIQSPILNMCIGTGLGLYLVKTFSKMMGGDVSVESKDRKGTTFTFYIRAEEKVEDFDIKQSWDRDDSPPVESSNKDKVPSLYIDPFSSTETKNVCI